MLDKLTGKPVHYWIHFVAICGIVVGLPWSKIPLSLGTILLGFNLILKWDWKSYWNNWKTNPWLRWFLLFLVIDWISLLWSANISAGLEDIRTKIPLYTLPLSLTALPLTQRKHLNWIGALYIGAMLFFTSLNFAYYKHWIGHVSYNDIRGMSLFVSHIRFSLMVVFAIVLLASWFIRRYPYRFLTFPLVAWFLFYAYYSQVVSGYLVLAGVVMVVLYFKLQSINRPLIRRSLALSFVVAMIGFTVFVLKEIQPIPPRFEISADMINSKTANGNQYLFDIPEKMVWENGYPIQGFVCEKELMKEWNKASDLDYYGTDPKGNKLSWVIMRYMTSKGLKKDSLNFHKLSQQDIRNIEQGIASVQLLRGGVFSQLYRIRRQLVENEEPNGQSLLERIEYVKAGIYIIKNNGLFGVGMGDKEDAFQEAYRALNSKLLPENRNETHNQYLTSWITSGILGFVAFSLWWLSFFSAGWKKQAVEWTCFAVICMLSFLTEDTLETQTGNTFVAFFFGLIIANHGLLYRQKGS